MTCQPLAGAASYKVLRDHMRMKVTVSAVYKLIVAPCNIHLGMVHLPMAG